MQLILKIINENERKEEFMKKKINMGFCILLLLLVGFSGCGKKQQVEVKKEEERNKKWYVTQEDTVGHLYLPELKTVITKERKKGGPQIESVSTLYEISEPRVSTDHIVYDNAKKLVTDLSGLKTMVKVDYYYLNVYSYKDNFSFVKKIDLKKQVNNFNKNYLPYQVYPGIQLINGKEYISVNIYNKETKNYGEESVFVGLDKEDIIEDSAELKVNGFRWEDASSDIIQSGITNLPESLGYSAGGAGNSLVYYEAPKTVNKLMNQNTRLAEIFTSASNENVYVSFPDESVPIETIVQALLPEGENMYENLVLYGKYSKDGQDHEIHSMEEFLEWYQEKK
jgi:hypothetical protein